MYHQLHFHVSYFHYLFFTPKTLIIIWNEWKLSHFRLFCIFIYWISSSHIQYTWLAFPAQKFAFLNTFESELLLKKNVYKFMNKKHSFLSNGVRRTVMGEVKRQVLKQTRIKKIICVVFMEILCWWLLFGVNWILICPFKHFLLSLVKLSV